MSEEFERLKEQMVMQLRVAGTSSGLGPLVGVLTELEGRIDTIEARVEGLEAQMSPTEDESNLIIPEEVKPKKKGK